MRAPGTQGRVWAPGRHTLLLALCPHGTVPTQPPQAGSWASCLSLPTSLAVVGSSLDPGECAVWAQAIQLTACNRALAPSGPPSRAAPKEPAVLLQVPSSSSPGCVRGLIPDQRCKDHSQRKDVLQRTDRSLMCKDKVHSGHRGPDMPLAGQHAVPALPVAKTPRSCVRDASLQCLKYLTAHPCPVSAPWPSDNFEVQPGYGGWLGGMEPPPQKDQGPGRLWESDGQGSF